MPVQIKEAEETQYGIEYPSGTISWNRTRDYDICTKAGQEQAQKAYELGLEEFELKTIPKLKFVKRVRTILLTHPESFEAE